MDAHLRAGVAVYNAGGYHAAHDAWEDHWLGLEAGTDDERLLHGLIQFTAAVHHAYGGNWEGLRGLATSAADYLDGLPDGYRGVNVDEVRAYLRALRDDPEHVERVAPPELRHGGRALGLSDLDFEGVVVAAEVLAEEVDAYDEAVVEDAIRYARDSLPGGGRFVALVSDFVTDAGSRDLVHRRLAEHVARRRGEERDVDGLFDPE